MNRGSLQAQAPSVPTELVDRLSAATVGSRTCSCVGVEFGSYDAQIEMVAPPHLERADRRGICVDACLALEVKRLWDAGIATTGCCCGHGKLEPTISVAPSSETAMSALGYRPSPLVAGRSDIFTAKTGWPVVPTQPRPCGECKGTGSRLCRPMAAGEMHHRQDMCSHCAGSGLAAQASDTAGGYEAKGEVNQTPTDEKTGGSDEAPSPPQIPSPEARGPDADAVR